MPSFFVWAVASIGASIGGTVGAFLIMNATAIVGGAFLLGGLALSAQQANKAKRKARDAFNAAQVDRLVNVTSTIAPRELVLGRVRKGGQVFFKASTGTNKTTFVMCIALAAHEIDAVEQVYFNDVPVTLDGSGNVTDAPYATGERISATAIGTGSAQVLPHTPISGTISAHTGTTFGREGDYAEVGITGGGTTWTTTAGATIQYQYLSTASNANVRAVLGSPFQAADARIQSLFPGLWTASHTARSVAYLICEFTYSESSFPSGLPVVTAVIRGAKVYDPRTLVVAWSENPALHLRHIYTHPAFGKAATVSASEEARIIAAADACDAPVAYYVAGVPAIRNIYRTAMVVPFGATAKDTFDDLAQGMAGSWAFAGGELYLKAGVWSASVMSLTEADLAVIVRDGASEEMHPISIAVHRERASKFNIVNVQIWDSEQEYKQVSLTPLESSALITRDGARLAQAVTMPAVSYAPQALHIAGVMMRDARDPLTVEVSFKLRAYPLELFDTVDLTIARYGWTSKLFEVRGRSWNANGHLQLTLKETSATIYTKDANFSAQGYAVNSSLPSPWYVPPIGALIISSGTDELLKQDDGTIISRMRVSWAPLSDSSITLGGSVEVQYRSVLSSTEWLSVQVNGGETQLLISDVQDGARYNVRARARNRVVVGNWNNYTTHTVVGKTAPPPPFDAFLVLVQPDGTRQYNFNYLPGRSPVDWLGAAIRYIPGSDPAPDWDVMTQLQDDQTYYTSSPVELNAPLAGEYTFACKSIDTSGLLSSYLLRTITLPNRRLGNVYDEFFEHLEGWTGVKTDCHVQGTQLEADDTTTWATLPATWDGWTRWNVNPASPIQYETPARDFGTIISGQINSAIDADGTVVQELATSADGISWSSWSSAAAQFSTRYLKLRLTVTATGPAPVPAVRTWSYQIESTLLSEYINDLDISTLTGSYRIGTGDIRIPLTGSYNIIKRTTVVIQDSTAGTWTSTRIDQSLSPGPRWQFRLNGTLADPAFVDFFIEGY